MGFSEGDIVKRKSYNCDVIFKVANIEIDGEGRPVYLLRGIHQRLLADAFEEDLLEATEEDIKKCAEKFAEKIKKIEGKQKRSNFIYRR